MDVGVECDVPATSVWGITYQVLEQLGFRVVADRWPGGQNDQLVVVQPGRQLVDVDEAGRQT